MQEPGYKFRHSLFILTKQYVKLDGNNMENWGGGVNYFIWIILFNIPTYINSAVLCAQLCPTLCDPMDCRPPGPWNFPGKNTRVGCHFLLQGNLPGPGIERAHISWSLVLAGRFFTTAPPGKLKLLDHQRILYICKLFLTGSHLVFNIQRQENTQRESLSFLYTHKHTHTHLILL